MPRAQQSPVRKACLNCSAEFSTTDARKTYCGRSCKDAARNHTSRVSGQLTPRSQHNARRSEERQATQDWIYDTIYAAPLEFRADVVMAFLIFAATSCNSDSSGSTRCRDILTYPTAQRSNRFTAKDKGTAHLHYRGQSMAYPVTIASMANHVCKSHLGISSSEFMAEIKRDGVTMADMQAVYEELLDTVKPEPVIRGCNIEEPATGPLEPLATTQIALAKAVLADPLVAARKANEIGTAQLLAADTPKKERADASASDMLRVDQAVQATQERADLYLAAQAGALDAANARFMQMTAHRIRL